MSPKIVQIFNSFNQKLAKISCFVHVLMRVCKYIHAIVYNYMHIAQSDTKLFDNMQFGYHHHHTAKYFALVQCQRLRISGHQVQSRVANTFSNTVSNFVFISIHHALLFSLICIARYVLYKCILYISLLERTAQVKFDQSRCMLHVRQYRSFLWTCQ